MKHKSAAPLMIICLALVANISLAGVEAVHPNREVIATVTDTETMEYQQQNEYNLYPGPLEIHAEAALNSHAHAWQVTDIQVDENSLRLTGSLGAELGRETPGVSESVSGGYGVEISFDVTESGEYRFELSDVLPEGSMIVVLRRTDIEQDLFDIDNFEPMTITGNLEAGGSYVFRAICSLSVPMNTDVFSTASGFSLDFEVTCGAVAIEAISLSNIKALFD